MFVPNERTYANFSLTVNAVKLSLGKKQTTYTEERVAPLARKLEVDSLRSRIVDVKKELQREIEESMHSAKFDLLHDPSPQADNVKVQLQIQ